MPVQVKTLWTETFWRFQSDSPSHLFIYDLLGPWRSERGWGKGHMKTKLSFHLVKINNWKQKPSKVSWAHLMLARAQWGGEGRHIGTFPSLPPLKKKDIYGKSNIISNGSSIVIFSVDSFPQAQKIKTFFFPGFQEFPGGACSITLLKWYVLASIWGPLMVRRSSRRSQKFPL